MSSISLKTHPVNFTAKPFQDPNRAKIKVRSRPLYDISTWVSNKISDFGQIFIRDKIFFASSNKFKNKMDSERLEESRTTLREIGGSSLVLETVEGTKMEAMYFDVDLFKQIVLGKGGHFAQSSNGKIHTIRSYTTELSKLLKKMKLEPSSSWGGYDEFVIPSASTKAPLLEEKEPGVTILTQGNACVFEMDRGSIIHALLRGQSCMVYNIRGTGRSDGAPTEMGTYSDIETVYQFLRFKGYKDEMITVEGYCLGGGQASELAKRHPINISLDRTFPSVSTLAGEVVGSMVEDQVKDVPYVKGFSGLIVNCVSRVTSFFCKTIIHYPVQENLKQVKGHVHIADATEDDLIPKGSGDKLFSSASPPSTKVKSRLVLENHEHCSEWSTGYKKKYADHLNKAKVLREFGHTVPPSYASRAVTNASKALRNSSASLSETGSKTSRACQSTSRRTRLCNPLPIRS